MSGQNTRTVSFRWPVFGSLPYVENFFVGAWHKNKDISAQIEDAPSGLQISSISGANWLILSSNSPLHSSVQPLVHGTSADHTGLAFRGYITDPPIHSYSPAPQILDYWNQGIDRRHNGVFAAAIVDRAGKRLTLLTDAFGFAPLYYREWNGFVLFSSNPRFLAVHGDVPDLIAWRSTIQSGFIGADRSLTKDVFRVPAGVVVRASESGISSSNWFDFDSLPDGQRPVDEKAFGDVEESFQQSVSRCLAFSDDMPLLPLSSGHDSRRILAAFISRNVDFSSLTVRVRQKGFRDLDAPISSAMSQDFNFCHSIVEQGTISDIVANDIARRTLTDVETMSHSWAVALAKALPDTPSVIFDGILGDILGNPGFRMPGMYLSSEQDLELILDNAITDEFDNVLPAKRWPTAFDIRGDISKYLRPFMHRYNMAEFAFILLRQRRSTSLWSQHMMPAGHIIACPYLDLDYISLMLEFRPEQKHETVFQRQCLERFWPRLASYEGNRDIPKNMMPGDPALERSTEIACFRQCIDEIRDSEDLADVSSMLGLRKRLLLALFRGGLDKSIQWSWGTQRLFELHAREVARIPCWSLQ